MNDDQVRRVALSITRCAHVPLARQRSDHPCRTIVTLQPEHSDEWQVPEGWTGNLTEGKILFLSSNPSISEASPHDNPLHPEDYPRGSWDDGAIADFAIHRFGEGEGCLTSIDGRQRQRDGQLSAGKTRFWLMVRARAAELIQDARADHDYVMSEVVHRKSRQEVGVAEAVPHCVETHLDGPLLRLAWSGDGGAGREAPGRVS